MIVGERALVVEFATTPNPALPPCIIPEVIAPWIPACEALLNVSCILAKVNSGFSPNIAHLTPTSKYSCVNSSKPSLSIPAKSPFPSRLEIPGIPPNKISVAVSDKPETAPYKYAWEVE